MQYTLSNGKEHVYQWDKKIVLTITEPADVPQVHFKWGGKGVPLPVTNQQVEIPPELMQLPHDIVLWAYTPDHTMDMATIKLEQKPKPADYVYTPTEIKTWEELDARIEALEKGGGIAGVSSVNGQTGEVEITAKGLGALTEDDLQSATNAALAQAKASGEFDGAPGVPGTPGTDGYSPSVTVEQTDTGATITATDKAGTTTATVKNGSPGAPGASGTTPHIGDNGNWYLGETDTGKPSQGPAGAGLDVTGATVGQIVKIAAVDSDGVPTEWVPVDMGGKKQIAHYTVSEECAKITITMDDDGNELSLTAFAIAVLAISPEVPASTNRGIEVIAIPQSGERCHCGYWGNVMSAAGGASMTSGIVDLERAIVMRASVNWKPTNQFTSYGGTQQFTGNTPFAAGRITQPATKLEFYPMGYLCNFGVGTEVYVWEM